MRKLNPGWRSRRKYGAELDYWKDELQHLRSWFEAGSTDWWGIRPPSASEKKLASDLWAVNAVLTMHEMRPSYTEELRLERQHFAGQRVLEVGCGPLAPILQFSDCARHGLDPLLNLYVAAGWPLYEYDAKFVNSVGESMPYADGWFDSVISVNALDHVDNFERVASEMERVVKPGGGIYFEVEYHEPTVTEPVVLDDARIKAAFSHSRMTSVINRTGKDVFDTLVSRFSLVPNQYWRFGEERYVTWHGMRLA